ncbi:MAG: DEAD/DEAH box helicase [Polyangiaceae bacterium]
MNAPATDTPSDEPLPTFDSLPLRAPVRQAVDDLGYVHPTPVQRAVFEPATRGRDLVVQARTGTGKTAAFGLPIVDSLVRADDHRVQALALCPTRELALQVTRELTALATHASLKITAVYGGAPMGKQIQELEAGAQIVIGTPGRVLDHLGRGTLDPSAIRCFVLDESDEMLSMGFLPQITDILSYLPEARQTLLFSATLPPDIQRMAETRLKNPEFVTLSGDHIGALEIDHFVYMVFGDKVADFLRIIEVENPESAVVFCNTRDETKRVATALADEGFAADWLNADLPQSDREKVMRRTREGKLRFLVATDVAARGIDISHLTHVINYDMPASAEAYVHRTGRTGRAGRTGTAISLIAPGDVGHLYYLRLTYKVRPIEKALPSSREIQSRREADLVTSFADSFSTTKVLPEDLALARRLLTHDNAERIVAGLLRSHLGVRPEALEEASASRRAKLPPGVETEEAAPNAPASELSREPREPREPGEPRESRESREPRRRRRRDGDGPGESAANSGEPEAERGGEKSADYRRHRSDPDLAEVFLNVGSRDGASQDAILDVLERGAGLPAQAADYVNVRHRHTFVGVQRKDLEKVIAALDGAVIAGKQASAEEARPRG